MPEHLRLHAFVPHSRANGPGLRAVVWVAGCSLHCAGCFNPATHDPAHGQVVSVADLFGQIVSTPGIEGVSLTGGEPLQQPGPVLALLRCLRAETKLSTLLFTGFWPHEIERMPFQSELPHLLDVLIAGRYEQEQRIASGLIGSASKTVHFYTKRYQMADLAATPPAEVIIGGDGTIVLSGIDPLQLYL